MQRVFPPSAGGKPENLQSSKPHNGRKEKKKRGHLAFGQTCLGSFGLLSIKAIRSIIHSSICHIAVSLTPKPPRRASERQTYKCSEEGSSRNKQPFTPSLPSFSLCLSVDILHLAHSTFSKTFVEFCSQLPALPRATFSTFRKK